MWRCWRSACPSWAWDKIFEGFTVLHISDLHAGPVGSDMELWQSLLKGKAFQAVVMTGDMVGQRRQLRAHAHADPYPEAAQA